MTGHPHTSEATTANVAAVDIAVADVRPGDCYHPNRAAATTCPARAASHPSGCPLEVAGEIGHAGAGRPDSDPTGPTVAGRLPVWYELAGPARRLEPAAGPTARLGPDEAPEPLVRELSRVADDRERGPRLPPHFIIRLAWSTHRAIYRVSGGRLGLWRPKPGRWGTLRLTTTGRRTGRPRSVIVGYLEDGPNLVTLAMNGWADPEPAWWARWSDIDRQLDAYAAKRSSPTAVVVLEPRPASV